MQKKKGKLDVMQCLMPLMLLITTNETNVSSLCIFILIWHKIILYDFRQNNQKVVKKII